MRLLLGNCLEVLKGMEANSVSSVVTDPPYGLKFMNKKWDYDVPSVDVWREVLRVLRPGGHLLSFGGTRTYHRMVVAIEDAGFEIRDQIQWLYGSGFPKSHNLEGEYEGWGTALKPANEPIVLARKPLEKGLTVAENVLKWGTGALNIDGSRIGIEVLHNQQKDTTAWHGNNWSGKPQQNSGEVKTVTGRWPANILLDEEAAQALDEQSGIAKPKAARTGHPGGSNAGHMSREKGDNKYNQEGIGHWPADNGGGASRFFYVAKASKRERGEGNSHPTVKPIKLMEYLIKLVTPPNGAVLDPFMGSGSTGVAAKNLSVEFIGIEVDQTYLAIAEKRIYPLMSNDELADMNEEECCVTGAG